MTQSDPGNIQPSGPSSGAPKTKLVVVAVAVVVVIAAAAGVFYFESHRGNNTNGTGPSYHLGTVSPARVANMSGNNFTSHYHNQTQSNSSNSSSPAAWNEVIFNETGSGSIPASIIIQSVEFHTSAEATSNYSKIYAGLSANASSLNLTFKNGTLNGFSYFTAVYSESLFGIKISVYIAVGHADKYAFFIEDFDVAMTNATALVQAEVSAMS
jgi:hypothetical protein